MKQRVIKVALVLATVLTMSQAMSAQEPRRRLPKSRPDYSEAAIIARFKDILQKELAPEKVCLSFKASKHLDALVRNAAAQVIKDKKFTALPEADANFRVFARQLVSKATTASGDVRITDATVISVLFGIRNPRMPALGGLCPLFPICK